MGLEISDAEPLTTFDRASQPAEWALSEESYSLGGATEAQTHRTRAPPLPVPASLAEFARANNNERSSAAWNYWNYFNGNDMSAWPKRYDVDGIEMEEKYDLDLQQARATS